jgi:hypothetical protein
MALFLLEKAFNPNEARDKDGQWTAVTRLVGNLKKHHGPDLESLVDKYHWSRGRGGIMPDAIDSVELKLDLTENKTTYGPTPYKVYLAPIPETNMLDTPDKRTLNRLMHGDIPAEWHRDPAYIDHLKKWSADSSLVGESGLPFRLFHGSPKTFTTFDTTKLGSSTHKMDAKKGFFFSTSPEDAGFFSFYHLMSGDFPARNPAGDLPQVYPVYVRLKKPLYAFDPESGMDMKILNKMLIYAKKHGFDGVVLYPTDRDYPGDETNAKKVTSVKNADDEAIPVFDGTGRKLPDVQGMTISVLDPINIKSASGNTGAFDSASTDIGKSVSVHPSAHHISHPGIRGGKGFRDKEGNWHYGEYHGPGPSMTPSTLQHMFRKFGQEAPVATQPWDDKAQLFSHAAEAQKELRAELFLATKKIPHVKVFDVGKKPSQSAYNAPGAMVLFAPIKGMARAEQKTMGENGGHWNRLLDLVRATVAVDNVPEIWSIIEGMERAGIKLARPPKNRFVNPTPAGYRDALLNVKLPNGAIGEVQIHLKPILLAKNSGHAQYEIIRTIEDALPAQGGVMTPVQLADFHRALDESQKLYGDAWEKSSGKEALKSNHLAPVVTHKYFQMENGALARHRYGFQPEVRAKGQWKPLTHLTSFAFGAHSVPHPRTKGPSIITKSVSIKKPGSRGGHPWLNKQGEWEYGKRPTEHPEKKGLAPNVEGHTNWPEGLPQVKVSSMTFDGLLATGHFVLSAEKRESSYGDPDYHLLVNPRITNEHIKEIPSTWPGEKARKWYDDRLATLEETYKLGDYQQYAARVKKDLPPGMTAELPEKEEKGTIFRGLSYEEIQSIRKTGVMRSKGEYNIGDEQKGLTYFADNPGTASSYGGNFAPPFSVPTFDRPGYVVKIARPSDKDIVLMDHIPGEVGVKGAIPREKILAIYEMLPYEVEQGEYDLNSNHMTVDPTYEEGSSVKPGSDFVYRKIENVQDFLGNKTAKSILILL